MSRLRTKATTPNRELVVYVLHVLGGAVERIHTEDIANKAHALFGDSFSWTKYPEYPDKDIVRVALTDARKEKYGALIEGRTGQHRGQSGKSKRSPALDGWILTKAGVAWIKENQDRLETIADSGAAPKEHRQRVLKQLGRVRSHRVFADFLDDPELFIPQIGGMAELFRCRVDAEEEVWVRRFEAIRRKARVAEQQDLLDFVDACESAYRSQR